MFALKRFIVRVLRQALPIDSRRRHIARVGYQALRDARTVTRSARAALLESPVIEPTSMTYQKWKSVHLRPDSHLATLARPERFTVVIIESGATESREFLRTRESLRAQHMSGVEVRVVKDGSAITPVVADIRQGFVVFVRAGDVLAPDALSLLARAHRSDPALKLITFDSDVFDPTATTSQDPTFRPAWSPDALLGENYIGFAFAIASSVIASIAGVTADSRGIWSLLLSANFTAREVGRVPEVLLTHRGARPAAATDADAAMVAEILAGRSEMAVAHVQDGRVRVRFEPERWPLVTVVIPTRHSRQNLSTLFPSLAATDYPSFEVIVMDNGGETPENQQWYADMAGTLKIEVVWWTETPFNYSRVNNAGVARGTGPVVIMLNDDTEIVDSSWMREMVGMLLRDGVGTVGYQHLRADGRIQHGGVTLGPGGFADNLFVGIEPGSATLLGPTGQYRNCLAVTGACVAIRRKDFESGGGLDERFILCGSDVVLGLDQIIVGKRNVVIPFDCVRHYESVTRGSHVPLEDFYASYWRYSPWLRNGDPYSSPNVSRLSAVPRFASYQDEPPVKLALETIGRRFGSVAQSSSISEEAMALVGTASVSADHVAAVGRSHHEHRAPFKVESINWYIPDVEMPFFGGLNTAFRIADKLARDHGVRNRFVVLSEPNEQHYRSALAAAFPGLGSADFHFYNGQAEQIDNIPSADAAVATLWLTAAHVAKAPGVKRRFYLMQDYEPAFYPASSMFAMAEETYRLGLYGLCNTKSMLDIYKGEYRGKAISFTPAVDRSVYHPVGRREKSAEEPITIFAYARDHFRNCWELVYPALAEIKRRHGDGVRIVAAGARYLPEGADFIDMGLLDYRATGDVYRETDIGITMQISRHPSYLPLELMASGVAMVAPDSEWFAWLFEDGVNAELTMRTLDDIVANLELLITDTSLRSRISIAALATIDERHSDWEEALSHIYGYMCDPEGS